MTANRPGGPLVGREPERRTLSDLLAMIRSGRSRALILRGDAGIGKTALLEYLRASATDCLILETSGVESDMELAYAGLQQMCAPVLDTRFGLPEPQRHALESAFGLSNRPAADRFLVGLAVIGLLAAASERQPVLCLIDDAQWLDHVSVQTLFFVGRRLLAERVGFAFALRQPIDGQTGIPELPVAGLSADDAHALLRAAFPGRLDDIVCDRIVRETDGNPLALLEIPNDLTAAEVTIGYPSRARPSVVKQLERRYVRELRLLPGDSRLVLLLAAAEPTGDVALMSRAMSHLGLEFGALTPAQAVGLIDVGARIRFRHPLVRAAAYRAAGSHERRAAHHALAVVTDLHRDPDRRAWHRALAAEEPDESVASELVRSAGRARQRGGIAAAAAFLTRAAELTPDAGLRSDRALAAAEAHRDVASFDIARELLSTAGLAPTTQRQRARLAQSRTRLAFLTARAGGDADVLVDTVGGFAAVADALRSVDPASSGEAYLEALTAAMYVGRRGSMRELEDIAAAARSACAPADGLGERSPVDSLAYALAVRLTSGPGEAQSAISRALHTVTAAESSTGDGVSSWFWRGFPIVHESLIHEVWDDRLWADIADRAVRFARETGALVMLPAALVSRAGAHVEAGEFAAASALIAESDSITAAIGYAPTKYHKLGLAAWCGDEDLTADLATAAVTHGEKLGEGRVIALAARARAILNNGLGRYQVALESAQTACAYDDLGIFAGVLFELIEAAARAGDRTVAAEALEKLDTRTRVSGTHFAKGTLARSRALLTDDRSAEDHYLEAISLLGQTLVKPYSARAYLGYGEWLRRQRRHTDAREQLRRAHGLFSTMGAKAFAERARRELLAAGEKVSVKPGATGDVLSPQEQHIAQLAAEGLTNQEIAAQLFISGHTVEWHLRKVFAKLQIRSRRDLRNIPLS